MKAKLRVLRPSVRVLGAQPSRPGGSAYMRAPESVRTKRRLKLWTQDPHCQGCRKLVDYPWGFELDHVVPLSQGGADTEGNSQVLCIECHKEKSRAEAAGREWRPSLSENDYHLEIRAESCGGKKSNSKGGGAENFEIENPKAPRPHSLGD